MARKASILFTMVLAATCASATATVEDGYEVTRSQTLVPVPRGKVGRKTIDRETRVGVRDDTAGSSLNFTMTLGGFMSRCPMPEGSAPVRFVVPGDFEYSVISESVNTDVAPTERRRYEKRMTARIKVFVNDDLSTTEGEIDGEFSSNIDGVRTGPVRLHQRFPIRAYGTPDFDALLEAVTVTGDMAAAAVMWNASNTILESQLTWRKPNECAELEFEPPSETRTVTSGETVEIRVKYRSRDGRQPIPKGSWDAAVVQGGQLPQATGQVKPDGTFVVRYVARTSGAPKPGDGARIEALSAAGYARDTWYVTEALTLAIEHRIMSRRDTVKARMGMALFDGDVRFDVRLEPFPGMRGEFRGKRTVRRDLRVGHITPRCTGSASQSEEWDLVAHLDAGSETLVLEFGVYYPEDGAGFWICDGLREDVYVDIGSGFPDQSQVRLSSRSGTRQQFSLTGPESQETLIVTVH